MCGLKKTQQIKLVNTANSSTDGFQILLWGIVKIKGGVSEGALSAAERDGSGGTF